MKEYCELELFRAECKARDEMIRVTHARYGRMRDGRCITNTYGSIGCFTDVRSLLETACSARRRCDVTVATLVPDHAQPCAADFRSYLEATYECVKGRQASWFRIYHFELLLLSGMWNVRMEVDHAAVNFSVMLVIAYI